MRPVHHDQVQLNSSHASQYVSPEFGAAGLRDRLFLGICLHGIYSCPSSVSSYLFESSSLPAVAFKPLSWAAAKLLNTVFEVWLLCNLAFEPRFYGVRLALSLSKMPYRLHSLAEPRLLSEHSFATVSSVEPRRYSSNTFDCS